MVIHLPLGNAAYLLSFGAGGGGGGGFWNIGRLFPFVMSPPGWVCGAIFGLDAGMLPDFSFSLMVYVLKFLLK